MKMKALKAAFPYTIPVLMGYIFLGMAFGILLTSSGYHFLWAILMSVIIYAGSMQFVAVGPLNSIFDPISTLFITLLVNARHTFYGLSMLHRFKGMGRKKPYMIFSLTDETYSLLCSVEVPKEVDSNWFIFFIALLNQSYWVIGCTIGGMVGSVFTFNTKGIDFVMTALFLVIFIEQWQSTSNHLSAIIGVFASIICLIVFGPDRFIIPAMLSILILLILLDKKREEENDNATK